VTFYFGNKNDPFYPDRYLESTEAFAELQKKLGAKSLTFLKQVHGIIGYYIDDSSLETPTGLSLQEKEGDFLITDKPGHAIGVLTADCLPLILYDPVNNACGVVHAGWRGSVNRIAQVALEAMSRNFNTKPEIVKVYVGPCAKNCCYEVSEEFIKNVSNSYKDRVFLARNGKIFFDNLSLNIFQLLEMGVFEKNIVASYNTCTICDDSYHSYRRSGNTAGRQVSVVVL
jgi:polyphenol oxidase